MLHAIYLLHKANLKDIGDMYNRSGSIYCIAKRSNRSQTFQIGWNKLPKLIFMTKLSAMEHSRYWTIAKLYIEKCIH